MQQLISILENFLAQTDFFIQGYKKEKGLKVLGYSCDNFPVEVVASFGVLPLRLPPDKGEHNCYDPSFDSVSFQKTYDFVVTPALCQESSFFSSLDIPSYQLKAFSGYGEKAALEVNQHLGECLMALKIVQLSPPGDNFSREEQSLQFSSKQINLDRLKESTQLYNNLRRIIRGITNLRREKPGLLTQQELSVILRSAVVLPPELILEYLSQIFKRLSEAQVSAQKKLIPVLVYGGLLVDGDFLDQIEQAGFLVSEDDFCQGRRQFDLSHNENSPYLYAEILDAFSYRPLCSCLRPPSLRYELLYKLIKNYGIEAVIFLEETCCCAKKAEIEFLRVRLMRSGVDPLVVSKDDFKKQLSVWRKLY